MSPTIPEVEAFVSVQLSMLAERNEHHVFERIATRIARRRLSSNILVANGPVSAGGDQGRDAESYTTYIPDELPHSAGFAATASKAPVVLACTVQKSGLKAKVLKDLAGICADGAAPVDLVAVFSAANISEALTHELQKVARDDYNVKLEVFSGVKLATMLAEPQLIWIAQADLHLPSSMVPTPDTLVLPDWYSDLINALRGNGGPATLSPATQGEIAAGLRHATWDKHANEDLPEWIDYMGTFLLAADETMVFRACYEMTIARFRGTGIAAGTEDLVRRALEIAETNQETNILDDAAVLVSYWGTMWISGAGRATISEIQDAFGVLVTHVTAERAATDASTHPVRAASLTGTLAWLHLLPDWSKIEATKGTPRPVDAARGAGVTATVEDLQDAFDDAADFVDLPAAMDYLTQLAALLPRARGYALSQISELVLLFAPLLSTQPGYKAVQDAFDDAVEALDGDSAVGERHHTRAMALYRGGKLIDALAELHRAKLRSLRGDLNYTAINVMRMLARVYLELGMTFASKMHACHAVTLGNLSSDDDDKALISAAIFDAASAAHFSGCWVDAAALTRIGVSAHHAHAAGGFDLDKHPALRFQLQVQLRQLVTVRTFWADREEDLAVALGDVHEYLAEQALRPEATLTEDEDTFQDNAPHIFFGPIFADLGAERVADFEALGVRWIFTYENRHDTVLAAEGFIAAFQVVLADAASYEPVLFPCTVHIGIESDSTTADVASITSVPGSPYALTVTVSETVTDVNAFTTQLVGATLGLFSSAHVRPDADFEHLIDEMMKAGLGAKVLSVRPHQESADLLYPEHYIRCAAGTRPSSSSRFTPENAHLAASVVLGPGYDADVAVQAVRHAYESAETWKYTLAALLGDPSTRERIAQRQADGWLDWQILGALTHVALQWRFESSGIDPLAFDASSDPDVATRAEDPSDPRILLPIQLDEIDIYLYGQATVAAGRWGVRPLPERSDGGGLRDLLTRRYRFADVDVPHRDLLSSVDADGNLLPLVSTTDETS